MRYAHNCTDWHRVHVLGATTLLFAASQEALHLLRSEKEAYAQERTAGVARIEAITKEYDNFRRQAALTEAELSR